MRWWRYVPTDDTIYTASWDSDDADSLDGWTFNAVDVEVLDSVTDGSTYKYNVLKVHASSDSLVHYIQRYLGQYVYDRILVEFDYYIPSANTNVDGVLYANSTSPYTNTVYEGTYADRIWGDTTGAWAFFSFDYKYSNDYYTRLFLGEIPYSTTRYFKGEADPDDIAYITNFRVMLREAADSTQATSKVLTVSDLAEDEIYKYDFVTIPQGGNDSYSNGEDSSFTTILSPPNSINVVCMNNYELIPSWDEGTTRNGNGTAVEYDTSGGSSWERVDTVAQGVTSYAHSGLLLNGVYKYRMIHLGYNNESAYSNIVYGTVTLPNYQFTFVPAFINIVVDSTAGGGSATTGDVFNDDFEDGTFDAWTTVTSDIGDTNYVSSDTVKSGTYAAFFEWNGVGNDSWLQIEPANLDATKLYFAMDLRVNHFFRGQSYGKSFATVSFWDGGAEVVRLFIVTGNTDENPDYSFLFWQLWSKPTNYNAAEQEAYTHNTWMRIEVGWDKADSIAIFKVDGVEILRSGALDHTAYLIDKIRVGAYSNVPMDSSHWYVDNVGIDSSGWLGAYSEGGGSADSVTNVLAINNSGGVITLNDITGEAAPFTVAADSTLPEAVADDDTLEITVTLNMDTSGTFDQTAVFEIDEYANQNYIIYAKVSGAEIPGGGGDCGDAVEDSITVPQNLSATYNADSSAIILTWDASPDAGNVTDTYIMRAAENECCGNEVPHPCYDSTDAVGSTVIFTDNSVNAGSVYDYKLRFKKATGDVSDWSVADSALVPAATEPDTTKPEAPTNLLATGYYTGGSTYINLGWTESVSSDKDSIHIWATPVDNIGGTFTKLITLAEGTTEHNDTTLEAGEERRYKITQQDDSLNVSEFSDTSSAIVPSTQATPPPDAPSALAGIADTLAIHLTWTDNSSDEDSFFVYRDGSKINSLTAGTVAYIDTPLLNNTSYEHKVSAWNSAGGESNFSNIINTTTSDTTTYTYDSWYVDKNASGGNNGTSWTNAWETFSAINWSSINPGDCLYVSGGVDSVEYNETLTIGASGSWGNYLYVMAGKYSPSPSGHSGRVIIDGDSTRSRGIFINGLGGSTYKHWIYVKGFESRNHLSGSAGNGGIAIRYAVGHIVIDSCMVYENAGFNILVIPNSVGQWTNLYTDECAPGEACDSSNMAFDIEIKNCRVWTYKNNSNKVRDNNCDDLIQAKGVDKFRLHDNFLWNRNTQADVPAGQHAHQDGIQIYTSRDVRIWNNVIIHDSAALGHPILIGAQTTNNQDTSIIYNNFLYGGGYFGAYSMMILYVQEGATIYDPFFVFHNTIVGSNGRTDCIMQSRVITMAKNNILVHLGTNYGDPGSSAHPVWRPGSRTNYADSTTNNLIWSWYNGDLLTGGAWVGSGGSPVGSPSSWADWINNYGGTGVNDNPDFVEDYYNIRTEYGYRLQSTSPAIDTAGTDVKAFIESKGLPWTDIEGNTRDSTPDCGAYEYVP